VNRRSGVVKFGVCMEEREMGMLCLSRKVGQSIVLADGTIEINVLDIARGCVRIGISAPKDIDINRKEVYEQIVVQRSESECNPEGAAAG